MKRTYDQMACNSEEETNKKKDGGLITEFFNSSVELTQQSQILNLKCGEIKLAGAPYYSLVLDVGSDVYPLTPIDSSRDLVYWISSVGQKVVISQMLAVHEDLQKVKEDLSVRQRNVFVKWDNVRLLKENTTQTDDYLEVLDGVLDMNRSIDVTNKEDVELIVKSRRSCRIVVHHVSTPFYIDEDTSATCLVLISYANANHLETKLWLVLRAEQVAWRQFLVSNREYLLHFPPETESDFFHKSERPLESIIKKCVRELRVIFHHKELFSKHRELNGSIVPQGSKMFLCSNTSLSKYIYKFTADSLWFRHWFSTSEADHATAPLVTFYGKVTYVKYLEEQIHKSCYLCIQKKPREPVYEAPKSTVPQIWMDPFKDGLVLGENELIELPNITDDKNVRMKTGVPGKLVQVIKLQDTLTGEERSVYSKHSYVSSCQEMVRLAPSMTICISHLNRRCSANGNYYYITTILSCCRILDYKDEAGQSEGWGTYGLQMGKEPSMKTWGVLEPFNVIKVAIRAKCTYCGALFHEGRCSNSCIGPGTYTTSAYAVAWINIVHEDKNITMEKVLVKDDLVRRLLQIPENVWVMLEEAAAEEEVIAFRNPALNESSASTSVTEMFQLYFRVMPREKCYVAVKKLPPQDEGDLYYCVNLEPINKDRLNIVYNLVAKTRKE